MSRTRIPSPRIPRKRWNLLFTALFAAALTGAILQGCGSGQAPNAPQESDATPAADSIGEALFLDTRFGEYFATHMTGVNQPLAVGSPVVDRVQTTTGSMPGPFAGQAINCRSCHFVTEFQNVPGAGNRTYADFASHSPLPRTQPDGVDETPRNAMQIVGSFTPRSGPLLLHFDGQFTNAQDLVIGTLTGGEFGWFPTQYNQAIAHIAQVIRQDNGSSQLAAQRLDGLSYSVLFQGTDPAIPAGLRLPASERLDVSTATDAQVVQEVALCIGIYMQDLLFQRDAYGRYIGSPYDAFLRVNHLPQQPLAGQTKAQYNAELYQQLLALKNPIYITPADGSFKYHDQPYQFGALELQGLKIFLASAATGATNAHAGNCASCHQAPDFSDFAFHNTGVTQEEYDNLHGAGAFMHLKIPTQAERMASFDAYMPATPQHPGAQETFRRPASAANPQYTDLGLWNIYLNPDFPKPQDDIKSIVCAAGNDCSVDQGLPSTIAEFKTPVLRDLEDSAPYFHNGSALNFTDVVNHYINMSTLAHNGEMRNPPSQFQHMSISQEDVTALVAFLKSLTEDYDDS